MYLEINKLFRKKKSLKLPTLKIKITDQNLLNKTNIDASVFIIDNEGNFLISDEKKTKPNCNAFCGDKQDKH